MKTKSEPAKKTAPKKQKRTRPPVTITLSEEAIVMAAQLARDEGQTLSRLVERYIRDSLRERSILEQSK